MYKQVKTPINTSKLSKKALEEFEKVKRFLETMASRVEVSARLYDEFLEAVSISERAHYKKEFPIGNKVVVRG